jgi:hypothetical protein
MPFNAPLARLAAAMMAPAPLLSGCAPPPPNYVVYDPLPPLTADPAPAPAPLPEPQPVVPEVALDLEDELPDPANAACMSAVGAQAGDFNVRVLGNETLAEGTEVTVGVGENLTPWRCVAGPSGEVVEVGEAG